MQKCWKVIILLLFCLLLFNISVNPVKAENANIHITIEEGFGGKVKRGEGFPLSIHIENKGESFSGDLLIDFHPSYSTGGSIPVSVELPKGSKKTYHVSMPGMTEDHPAYYQNIPSLNLYEGDWSTGENIRFTGDQSIKPQFIDVNNSVIGVLSENYDRLKELRVLPSTNMQMLQLKKEEIPFEPIGLEMLDYLLIDEYRVSQLEEQQQKAIEGWIQSGGVLIAGGSSNASGSNGLLYSVLPLKSDGETTGPVDFLKEADQEDIPFQNLQLFTGEVEAGVEVIETSGTIPVVIEKKFGEGAIIQTAFSLGDEPLAVWQGYNDWFENLLKNVPVSFSSSGAYQSDYYDQLYYEFAESNEYFPASSFSIGQLMALLAGYMIIAIPILYLVLRKLDKREHAWWVIPTLALSMAVVIFGIGAKDRIAKPQLNQMGVYKVQNDQLIGVQATTLLSNNSGDYSITLPKNEYHPVLSTNSISTFDPLRGAVFANSLQGSEVTFPNVEYWSSRTIYGNASKANSGSFIVDLTLENKHLSGTIQNGFEYDFTELFIWSGTDRIKLGAIKKGETLQVDQQIKKNLLIRPNHLGMNSMNSSQIGLEQMKQESLELAASSYLLDKHSDSQPILAGVTNESIMDVAVEGKKEKQNNLHLLLQPFSAKNEFSGPFTLKNEMLSTSWNVISGHLYENKVGMSNSEVMMEDGEYDYKMQLPEQLQDEKLKLEEIKINLNSQFVQYSIRNHETEEWVPIEFALKIFTLDESNHIDQFLSKDGEILLKLNKNANGDPYMQMPTITIKGEVSS